MCVLSIVLLFVFCISNAQPGCQWGRSFPWRPFVALLAPLSTLHNRNTLHFVFLYFAICNMYFNCSPPFSTPHNRKTLFFVFCTLQFVICISNAQPAPSLLRTAARLLQIQKQVQGQRIRLQLSGPLWSFISSGRKIFSDKTILLHNFLDFSPRISFPRKNPC